ncbi:MAG: deoxyribose-phosphate aldolase [bacterium]
MKETTPMSLTLTTLDENRRHIAAMIDHTLLKPEATTRDIERLCQEALTYGFAAVCVTPALLPIAVLNLKGSLVLPCTVVGFPLGASTTESKAFEAEQAATTGAREVDMVLAIGAIKENKYAKALADIRAVVHAAGSECGVKVILETCLLTHDEQVTACKLAEEAGARFVKTSTGFSTGGATVQDVALMRATVGALTGVKASGGIRTLADAEAMIKAGATRLGTSAGISIITAP